VCGRGDRHSATRFDTVTVDSVTDRLQDISVLNDVVEILAAGDYSGSSAIVSPQRVAVRNLLPLIHPFVMSVDIVPVNLGKYFCGFVKFV
jgi:hypothetical protein